MISDCADAIRADLLSHRIGIGARLPHVVDLLTTQAPIGFVELLADNHLDTGSPSHDLALALAEQSGLETVDLARAQPEKAALALVDGDTAHAFGALPLRVEGKTLVVAIGDPLNTAVLEDLRFTTGLEIRGVIGCRTIASLRPCTGNGVQASHFS